MSMYNYVNCTLILQHKLTIVITIWKKNKTNFKIQETIC